jgi:hypothetical protein
MRPQKVALLALAGFACAGEPTAPGISEPAETVAGSVGSWVRRTAYPGDVTEVTSATITDPVTGRSTMYVIGGRFRCCGSGAITDAVKAYDAATDTWKQKARFPVRVRSTHGATVLNGKIYVAGGFSRQQTVPDGPWRLKTLQSLYVYTPGSNTWARKRDLPEASVNGVSVAYQGKLYVATGSVVWRYDPATDRWSTFAERPDRDWWNASGGVIGGKLYLVQQFERELDILDLTTRAWSTGQDRPYRACGMASAAFQAKLYMFGSCDDYPVDPATRLRGLVFDPATNSWSEVAPAPNGGGAGGALARLVAGGQPRLSLVMGESPNNHYLFTP